MNKSLHAGSCKSAWPSRTQLVFHITVAPAEMPHPPPHCLDIHCLVSIKKKRKTTPKQPNKLFPIAKACHSLHYFVDVNSVFLCFPPSNELENKTEAIIPLYKNKNLTCCALIRLS